MPENKDAKYVEVHYIDDDEIMEVYEDCFVTYETKYVKIVVEDGTVRIPWTSIRKVVQQ